MRTVVLSLLLICLSLAHALPGAVVDSGKPENSPPPKDQAPPPPKADDKPKGEVPPPPPKEDDKPKGEVPPPPPKEDDKPKGEVPPPKVDDKPQGDEPTTTEIPLEFEVLAIFENDKTKVVEETVVKNESLSRQEKAPDAA